MILTVGNQKGGQAKSTTVQALVAGAKMRGRNVLAVDMAEAYQRAGEMQVRLLDYLRQFPRLQEEDLLRDAMTKGQLLTAAHRLKTLAAIQKTGKDPEAEPEPVKPFGEEEGTTWRSC